MVLSRLVKRKNVGVWYFVRRVPQEYQALDKRTTVQQSTGVAIRADPHGTAARRVAERMDAALESYWRGLAGDNVAKAMAEYQAACIAATKLGVTPPLPQQGMRSVEELLARIERLEHGKTAEDRASVAALLDAAPIPDLTFRQCAEQYIAAHKAAWSSAKHTAQWPATLAQYVYPFIGEMPVAQLSGRVGTQKVKQVLDPIWYTKPTTAMRVRGRIEKVLDWAKVQGYREGDNPARWRGHLDTVYPTKEKLAPVKHHTALPYRDVPAFMRKLRLTEGNAARALEFTILTAARSAEVLYARWSEIDKEARMWTVPRERMKMRRPHRQPLSDRAMAILGTLPKDTEFIFGGERKGKPVDHKALQRVLERMGVEATPHGFRSAFRDWGAEVGDYPNELLELALAHAVGDKVEAAYRRGDMLEKRAKLMADWAKFCG
ncbi:MAG TPA: site-specific integrase [Xanthobacteraceae bacterium]|jgi:integrase